MRVQSYLLFDGRCEEAIAFYRRVFGAEVEMLMRFKDSPESCDQLSPGSENKVMHAQIRIGETRLLMSDGQCAGKPNFQGFSLAASVSGEAEAEKLFADLSEGGQVQMPLAKTFFSPRFGMVADRFGVSWMILVAA